MENWTILKEKRSTSNPQAEKCADRDFIASKSVKKMKPVPRYPEN